MDQTLSTALPDKPPRIYRDAALILFIISFLGLVYLLVFGDNGYLELRKKEWEIRQIELQRNAQLELNSRLEEEISLLKTSRDRIEREAREQFKMVREGDIIVKTSPDAPRIQANPTDQSAPSLRN